MALDVRASALAVLTLVGIDEDAVEPLDLEVSSPPAQMSLAQAVIPDAPTPRINLGAVWWTAPRNEPVGRLAERWGMNEDTLRALNPTLKGRKVSAGERIAVFRETEGSVSRSVGAPNRGRLQHGVPFPEGPYWKLRGFRPRSFATKTVVEDLALALQAWGARHPGAARVKLGEFSRRGGGKIPPHSSHRTGRDVDVGYVHYETGDGHRFRRANRNNLDAKATWGLIRSLHATGGVERIFMDVRVQKLMLPYAIADLPPDELGQWFSFMGRGHRQQSKAFLRHWRGHDDHMHVRFECSAVDLNCREARSRKRRKRRRGKKKKQK